LCINIEKHVFFLNYTSNVCDASARDFVKLEFILNISTGLQMGIQSDLD